MLFISGTLCLFEFIRVEGGVKLMKYFNGGAGYGSKGTSTLASVSRPSLRPTQPPIQWVSGVLSRR
jgi:hypothetical protein